jgi:hypothetical protein
VEQDQDHRITQNYAQSLIYDGGANYDGEVVKLNTDYLISKAYADKTYAAFSEPKAESAQTTANAAAVTAGEAKITADGAALAVATLGTLLGIVTVAGAGATIGTATGLSEQKGEKGRRYYDR